MSADPTLEEEVRRLEQHYAVNPEGLVFARLADAYRRCGRLERSLELLREGLDRHPDYATGHLIQGKVLREAGRPDEAVDSYRRVLELETENLLALRSLAELAVERGEMGEARRWADRLRRADPLATLSPEVTEEDRTDGPGDGPDVPERGDGSTLADPRTSPSRGDEPDPDEGRPEPTASGQAGGTEGGGLPCEEDLASEISAMADEQWRRPADEPAEEDGEQEVATETMARLYAEQGQYEDAAEVYRRLADRRPDEPELRRRLEEMRRRAAGEDVAEEGATAAGSATSAREHFRALLRGRAEVGDGGRSRPDDGSPGALPEAVREASG